MKIKETIQFWANELLNPNGKDLLVNISESAGFYQLREDKFKNIPIGSDLKKILLQTKKNKRNLGVDALCFIRKFIVWEFKGNKIQTPLYLIPISYKENKINNSLTLEIENEGFVNPFLVKHFNQYINFNNSIEEIEIEFANAGLINTITELYGIANVHHHRFSVIKELDLLADENLDDSCLAHLLGFGEHLGSELDLSENKLFVSDSDQERVYEKLKVENLVVQGPPGTGKSQVISNVLAKSIFNENKTALISEKAVALSVIYEKLKAYNLHYLCSYYFGLKSSAKNVSALKKSWTFFENLEVNENRNLYLSKQRKELIQRKFDRLNSQVLIGGVSFETFKRLIGSNNINRDKFDISSPDISTWLKNKKQVSSVFNNSITLLGWTKIKNLKSYSLLALESLSSTLKSVIVSKEDFTKAEFEQKLKRIHFAKLFFFGGKELNPELLIKNSSTQKKFFKLYKSYLKLSDQLEILEKEKENWKKELSSSEISDYLKVVASTNKFNIKTARKRRALSKINVSDLTDFTKGLTNLKEYNEVKFKRIEILDKLRKLEIEPEKGSLIALSSILESVNLKDSNQIAEMARLSVNERLEILSKEELLFKLNDLLKKVRLNAEDSIFSSLKEIYTSIPFLVSNYSSISELEDSTIALMSSSKSVDEMEEIILASAYIKFEGLNPELANFDGKALKNEMDSILLQEKEERKSFGDEIRRKVKAKFEQYHEILNTPASKLTTEEKVLKVSLRKGKSVLIKEFGKSKQHKSPLELNSSEAKIWIDALQPIKLISTFQLGSDYPLTKNIFDLVVFDEASQIPLANSFGGVFRGKRILVAGDSQQMAPTSFFKTDFDTIDLLHQSQFYFKSTELNYHYRSTNPALIQFSNTNFYQNKLKTFQSYTNETPLEVLDVNGVYTENGNIQEAKKVAEIITAKIKKVDLDFGVVAFNEKQLKLIFSELSSEFQSKLEELIEDGILFKALENVQGDECAHLIISLGFGFNEEGKFDMRFGPINQENGHKRLNVLFSRAKEKMTIVRSVKASDFKISENNGVDLLRKFMLFLEKDKSNDLQFPVEINIEHTKKVLTLKTPYADFNKVNDLFTFYDVMQNRGWEISLEI